MSCHSERSEESIWNCGALSSGESPAGFFATLRTTSWSRWLPLLVLAICFFASANPAFAADDNEVIFPGGSEKSAAAAAPKSSSLNLVTLGVALILAGVGGWLVWRNRRGSPGMRGAQALAIEETRSLGNRQYLVVASYEGKKFLLGVCQGQINLLSKLNDAEEALE